MLNAKQDTSKKHNFLTKISIWIIENIHQKKFRPYLVKKRNNLCSFYPTCSDYGILALNKYGFFKGWFKTVYRVSRCNTYKHGESCIDWP